jgi:hypothetical protein
MFRADVYASKGQQAFDMAFEEAVQGGIGAWRLTNDYDDAYDPDNDASASASRPSRRRPVACSGTRTPSSTTSPTPCSLRAHRMSPEAFRGVRRGPDRRLAHRPLKTYYDWYTPDVVLRRRILRGPREGRLLRVYKHRATGESGASGRRT